MRHLRDIIPLLDITMDVQGWGDEPLTQGHTQVMVLPMDPFLSAPHDSPVPLSTLARVSLPLIKLCTWYNT